MERWVCCVCRAGAWCAAWGSGVQLGALVVSCPCSGLGRDVDSGNKATAFLENIVTVGGEACNYEEGGREGVVLFCSMSTSSDKSVNLPRYLWKVVMALTMLVVLVTFTFVPWKANIAPPHLPLPEESHTRLGDLPSRVQCWSQAHHPRKDAQWGCQCLKLMPATAMGGLDGKKGQHGYAVEGEKRV